MTSQEMPTPGLRADFYVTAQGATSLAEVLQETTAPWFRREIPKFTKLDEARELLAKLLQRPPQILILPFDLDQEKFVDMRASVLACGVVALAVQHGHRAVICAQSLRLPMAHWRAEFTFRAVSGIRKLQPALDSAAVLQIVTSAIQFCAAPDETDGGRIQ